MLPACPRELPGSLDSPRRLGVPLNLHVQEFISKPRHEEPLVMIHINQTCICS